MMMECAYQMILLFFGATISESISYISYRILTLDIAGETWFVFQYLANSTGQEERAFTIM